MSVYETIATVVIAAGAAWWATRMAFQIGKMVKALESISKTIEKYGTRLDDHEHRITVIEAKDG